MITTRSLILIVVVGCSGETEMETSPTCDEGIVGDLSATPEVEIVVRDASGNTRLAEDMMPVDLIVPPQGGKVFLVAPRVRNMDTCSLRVTATLRDECTNRILALEARPLRFAADADGWASPVNPHLISSWSNVPACPTAAAVRDVEGEPYVLTITVEDDQGRGASVSRHVVPTCAEGDERCLCECDASYRLGETCAPDDDSVVAEACP